MCNKMSHKAVLFNLTYRSGTMQALYNSFPIFCLRLHLSKPPLGMPKLLHSVLPGSFLMYHAP